MRDSPMELQLRPKMLSPLRFVMDKTMQDPSAQLTYAKFERPVADSKYIVSVKSKVLNWRNFLYFSEI